MQLLKDRIAKEGRALSEDILLVDSFLNHQVDVELMAAIGKEFARLFKDAGATRVATIEASGIAPAAMAALEMKLPLLVMKKATSGILSEDLLQTTVHSFTKGKDYQLTAKRRYIAPGDKVLFLDDFLANGEAAMGAIRLVEEAGASVVGIGCVIEKAFQPGRKRLMEMGYSPVALAAVSRLAQGVIEFVQD